MFLQRETRGPCTIFCKVLQQHCSSEEEVAIGSEVVEHPRHFLLESRQFLLDFENPPRRSPTCDRTIGYRGSVSSNQSL